MAEEVTAHDQMMEAHFRGDRDGAQALSEKVNIEMGTEQPQVAADPLALAPMPDAPKVEATEVDRICAKLTELGGAQAALVEEWKREGANPSEEIGYMRAGFAKYGRDDPELVAAVDASGLGDHPSVMKIMSRLGRLEAGLMGDFTVARNSMPTEQGATYDAPSRSVPRGPSAAQARLNQILEDTPVGSPGYKKASVQNELRQLNELIYGIEPAVGLGGRTA